MAQLERAFIAFKFCAWVIFCDKLSEKIANKRNSDLVGQTSVENERGHVKRGIKRADRYMSSEGNE